MSCTFCQRIIYQLAFCETFRLNSPPVVKAASLHVSTTAMSIEIGSKNTVDSMVVFTSGSGEGWQPNGTH